MDPYRFSVFVHLFCTILLTGMALFWVIMRMALSRRCDAAETGRLLQVAHQARWPHVLVPYPLRLPLPWLGLAIIAALVGSGALAATLGRLPQGPLWWLKLGLALGIVALQLVMMRRTRPPLYLASLLLVLAAIPVSAWLIR